MQHRTGCKALWHALLVAALLSLLYVPCVQGADEETYVPGETIEIHKGISDREWPQAGNIPQRTSYTPMTLRPPFRTKWEVDLSDVHPDHRIQGAVQVIIGDGRLYVGCKSGVMFALDAKTGEIMWQFKAGGAILNSAGYANGKAFFGAMDGSVYAVNARTGEKGWMFSTGRRYGISTAVLLAEDRVFIADRSGVLFALDQADGKEAWRYDAGAPVLQSAAYNAGQVYFASEDMRVHAVDAKDGTRVWRSKILAGPSFRYYWPVVVHGKVVVNSMNMYTSYNSPEAFDGRYKKPEGQSTFILDEKTGEETHVIEHYAYGHSGTVVPPALTADGLLVVRWPVRDFRYWKTWAPELIKEYGRKKWLFYTYEVAGWALQDLGSGEIVYLLEHTGEVPPPAHHWVRHAHPGLGAPDETISPTVLGNAVAAVHHDGWWGNPSTSSGVYDFGTCEWYWQDLRVHRDHSNQTGGSSRVSAADGCFYNISFNRVMCNESAAGE